MATDRKPVAAYMNEIDREALSFLEEKNECTASKAIIQAVKRTAKKAGWTPPTKKKGKKK